MPNKLIENPWVSKEIVEIMNNPRKKIDGEDVEEKRKKDEKLNLKLLKLEKQ